MANPKKVWTLIDMYGQITVYSTEKKAVNEATQSGYTERDGNDFYRDHEDGIAGHIETDEQDKLRLSWTYLK